MDIKDKIPSLYLELQNVWKVGKVLGMKGQAVHKYLTDRNLINKMNYFTKEDEMVLLEKYKSYREVGKLKELAKIMGRTDAFISRKAKGLGLTDNVNRISMKQFGDKISANTKRYIREKGHPKGMLGKKHTDEFKAKASLRSKKTWADKDSYLNSEIYKQKCSDRMSKMQASGKLMNNYSRVKNGAVEIGGKTYFYRSSWEANISAYFEFLKTNKEIKDWEYEPTTFWFEEIKRGVRSYKPDYRITKNNGEQYYVEVKGWMDDKSKTKLNRMRIYHPSVIIDLIDSKRYNAIKKNSALYKGWGALDNGSIVEKESKCNIKGCSNKIHNKNVCRKHYSKLYKK